MDQAITKKPRITVLMPVYNGEKYLREAIDSILGQTFKDFEFLIIDDGSTDGSAAIVKSYDDPRIRYESNGTNKGLPYTLNRGLELATGEYIARMDCDDVSMPTRLEKQLSFMEAHTDIAVCGSWIKTIGDRAGDANKFYTRPDDIKANLLFNTSLAHPSVMIRNSILKKFGLTYSATCLHYEDYDLWTRVARYALLANVPKILFLYRPHASSVSRVHGSEQKTGATEVRLRELTYLDLKPTPEDMRIHNTLRPIAGEDTSSFIGKEESWLLKILEANGQKQVYADASLAKIIYMRWRTVCGLNTGAGITVWQKFTSSPLFQVDERGHVLDSMKLLIKGLLRK